MCINNKGVQHALLILFFCSVIPAGFEPTTHSLEGCCSIQLSYGTLLRRKIIYSLRFFQIYLPNPNR